MIWSTILAVADILKASLQQGQGVAPSVVLGLRAQEVKLLIFPEDIGLGILGKSMGRALHGCKRWNCALFLYSMHEVFVRERDRMFEIFCSRYFVRKVILYQIFILTVFYNLTIISQ